MLLVLLFSVEINYKFVDKKKLIASMHLVICSPIDGRRVEAFHSIFYKKLFYETTNNVQTLL